MTLKQLSDSELQKILVEWNDTQADFPADHCLHQLFESHVARTPDAAALFYKEVTLSYTELNTRSNQLANWLIARGAGPETLIGICTERSIEMVVGIIGILKAGAAYVPIDPAYPKDRIRFILSDTHVSTLLTQANLAADLPELDFNSVYLDRDWSEIAQTSKLQPASSVNSENLCYVIYTSGSTGVPKGIALQHRGVVNNIHDLNTSFGIQNNCRTIAISALGFDMCVYEVLGTLAGGGAIVMPEQWGLKDPAHWSDLIAKHHVTIWNSAPALLEMLVDYIEPRPQLQPLPIQVVIQGGDWEPVTLPDRLRAIAPDAKVVVLGGATEASIHSIVYPVAQVDPSWTSIPYGKPMKNQTAYILNEDMQPVSVGETGELHLGGIGLARGYFERPELTAQKFIAHPFIADERLYRTGDLARWLPDGNIELIGRIDFQVKIRGHRIELGEISVKLEEHSDVQQAVVIMREDESGEKRLVAYVVPANNRNSDEDDDFSQEIANWTDVYNETYLKQAKTDNGSNFIGWNNSYTGLPFADIELRELVQQSVARILAVQPNRVLEIGCGTGLILLNVAPNSRVYDAFDLSEVAIKNLQSTLDCDNQKYGHVRLRQGSADDFSFTKQQHFDTVILNSVLQHFPRIDYLTQVITSAIDTLIDRSTFFLGDVRSFPLLETFHTSLECFMADENLPVSQLRERIRHRMRNEKELAVDPEYFLTLSKRHPRISNVAVVLKKATHQTEFNKYHYEVYVRIGVEANPNVEVGYYSWQKDVCTLEAINRKLAEAATPVVRIQGIPNARIGEDVKLRRTLKGCDGSATVGDLFKINASRPYTNALYPEEIWNLAETTSYLVDVCIADSREDGSFDAVFLHKDYADSISIIELLCESDPRNLQRKAEHLYANQPNKDQNHSGLVPALRKLLKHNLPEYMLPQNLIVLDRLPLTPNGKVDRLALPLPGRSRSELQEGYVAPLNALQEALTVIWSEILGLDKIGIHDSFFVIGGHSIKGVQIVSRIDELFELRVSLDDIFKQKTIANLAAILTAQAAKEGVDLDFIAETIVEMSKLSDEELQGLR